MTDDNEARKAADLVAIMRANAAIQELGRDPDASAARNVYREAALAFPWSEAADALEAALRKEEALVHEATNAHRFWDEAEVPRADENDVVYSLTGRLRAHEELNKQAYLSVCDSHRRAEAQLPAMREELTALREAAQKVVATQYPYTSTNSHPHSPYTSTHYHPHSHPHSPYTSTNSHPHSDALNALALALTQPSAATVTEGDNAPGINLGFMSLPPLTFPDQPSAATEES